VIRIKKISN